MAARINNAAWDAFFAIRKIVLDQTNSQTLHRIVQRKYKGTDYTKPHQWPGLDGEKQMGHHTWIDLTIPPQIVADVKKALPHTEIDEETKRTLAELAGIYYRLRLAPTHDHAYTLMHLREMLKALFPGWANAVNF